MTSANSYQTGVTGGNNPLEGDNSNAQDGTYNVGGEIDKACDNNYFTYYVSATSSNNYYEIKLNTFCLINEIQIYTRYRSSNGSLDGINRSGINNTTIKLLTSSDNDSGTDNSVSDTLIEYSSTYNEYGYIYYVLQS